MMISNELLDELLKGCKRPEDLLGDAGLMKELKVRLMERMLGAELTAHLGYEAGAEPPAEQANRRNGVATKRVKGSDGEVPLSVPRDRAGSFESASAHAFCTAGTPFVSTAPRIFTIWRAPSEEPCSLRRICSSAPGRTQSLNGAPLRSAPGLRSRTGT